MLDPPLHRLIRFLHIIGLSTTAYAAPVLENGDEFSNNLFSDLGPLLALFGERVTTQYLRHSRSVYECIIFACGPLGVLTAITSAIRVGGSHQLKAMIGRAEETDAQAEIELLSSTSEDVCELWNGKGFVRVVGRPNILEFGIILPESSEVGGNIEMRDLENSPKLFRSADMVTVTNGSEGHPHRSRSPIRGLGIYTRPRNTFENGFAPNLSINTTGLISDSKKKEQKLIAAVAIMLQSAVIAFEALVTYRYRWKKGGVSIAPYAFPLVAIGTLGLVGGMFLCAAIVEARTIEARWYKAQRKFDPVHQHPNELAVADIRIVWVQRSQTVGDQTFPAHAIYSQKQKYLETSHKSKEVDVNRTTTTTLICGISIAAFIIQFVGLRAVHYSASLAQLIITGIMILLRLLIHRNISRPADELSPCSHSGLQRVPEARADGKYFIQPLDAGKEIGMVAIQINDCARVELWMVGYLSECGARSANIRSPASNYNMDPLHVPTPGIHSRLPSRIVTAKRTLDSFVNSVPWETSESKRILELTRSLTSVINTVWDLGKSANGMLNMDHDSGDVAQEKFSWTIPLRVMLNRGQGNHNNTTLQNNDPQDVHEAHFENYKLEYTREKTANGSWGSWYIDQNEVATVVQLILTAPHGIRRDIIMTSSSQDSQTGSQLNLSLGPVEYLWLLCASTGPHEEAISKWWNLSSLSDQLSYRAGFLDLLDVADSENGVSDIAYERVVNCIPDENSWAGLEIQSIGRNFSIGVALRRHMTQLQVIMRYILFNFIYSIAGNINTIRGKTTCTYTLTDGILRLENNVITTIINSILVIEDHVDPEDAHWITIFALHAGEKLPAALSMAQEVMPILINGYYIEGNPDQSSPMGNDAEEFYAMCKHELDLMAGMDFARWCVEGVKFLRKGYTLLKSRGYHGPHGKRLIEMRRRMAREVLRIISTPSTPSAWEDPERDWKVYEPYMWHYRNRDITKPSSTRALQTAVIACDGLLLLSYFEKWEEIFMRGIDQLDDFNQSAILIALWSERLDILMILLLYGAEIQTNILVATAVYNTTPKTESIQTKILHLLLACGDPEKETDVPYINNSTVLQFAAREGLNLILQELLSHNSGWLYSARTNEFESGQPHMLHEAIGNGHISCVSTLLSYGVDVETTAVYDTTKMTALHYAAKCGHEEIVSLLLDRNANQHTRLINTQIDDHEGHSQEGSAMSEGFQTAVDLAAYFGHVGVVDILMRREPLATSRYAPGMYTDKPALAFAIEGRRIEVVKFLVARGMFIHTLWSDNSGNGILHLAAITGDPDILQVIMDRLFSRNNLLILFRQNQKMQTPLDLTIMNYNVEAVKVFMKFRETDVIQESIPHAKRIAEDLGYVEIAEILSEAVRRPRRETVEQIGEDDTGETLEGV
ncbi:hypothetical protein DFH27DRAFT_574581 [Peziza echinospora]|nr:hypothetical protein DFH27DRAFT_574581 [Peziza echinospora]